MICILYGFQYEMDISHTTVLYLGGGGGFSTVLYLGGGGGVRSMREDCISPCVGPVVTVFTAIGLLLSGLSMLLGYMFPELSTTSEFLLAVLTGVYNLTGVVRHVYTELVVIRERLATFRTDVVLLRVLLGHMHPEIRVI